MGKHVKAGSTAGEVVDRVDAAVDELSGLLNREQVGGGYCGRFRSHSSTPGRETLAVLANGDYV